MSQLLQYGYQYMSKNQFFAFLRKHQPTSIKVVEEGDLVKVSLA